MIVQALHTTQTRHIVDESVRGTQAVVVAEPPLGKGAWLLAVVALAFPAGLAHDATRAARRTLARVLLRERDRLLRDGGRRQRYRW